MSVAYSQDLRNDRLDAVTNRVGANGLLRIYGGTKPAPGGTPGTLLAELVCGDPFAPAASDGTLSANAIADGTAAASGEATWFRLTNSGGDFVVDGDAGESAAELILDDASLIEGGTVSVSSLTVTGGNAG